MDAGPPYTWDDLAAWLRDLPGRIGARPTALLIVSAHWEADTVTITAGRHPKLLYDYYGFPDHTYELAYPVDGDPALAHRISHRFTAAGIRHRLDEERGLDHGVFVPFKLVYPDASIPTVQVSLARGLDPATHLAIGRAMKSSHADGNFDFEVTLPRVTTGRCSVPYDA